MKKGIAVLAAVLVLSLASCAGYFEDMSSRDNGPGGLKTLALASGGTLSDDIANDQSPFLFRTGSRAYLFFTSDRGGNFDIYCAEMDATEKFLSPVKLDTNVNATNADESSVVFTVNNTNYITFIRRGSPSSIITVSLDSAMRSITQTGTFNSAAVTMIGLMNDPTNPTLLICNGTGTVSTLTFNAGNSSNWVNGGSFDAGVSVNCANGYVKNGKYYYIFSSIETVYGTRQIVGGVVSQTGSFSRIGAYSSVYSDFTPVVDSQNSKVYFSSDRYGKGNMDLYRYNTLTLETVLAMPSSLAPGIFVTPSGNDANNGLSILTPVKTIQIGVMKAVSNSFTNVYVQQGTYIHGSGLNSLSNNGVNISNNGICLSGGWNSSFSLQNGFSVLDGTNRVNHIIKVNNVTNVVINGFILKNGVDYLIDPVDYGGGLLMYNAYGCMVYNVIICSNYANQGGGMSLWYGASNVISVIATSNYAGNSGGGFYIGYATNNTFTGVFSSNYANGGTLNSGGGGVHFYSSTSNFLISAEVSWNRATYGSGIYMGDTFEVVQGCSIINNLLASRGTAIFFGAAQMGVNILYSTITNFQATNLIWIYQAGSNQNLLIANNLFGCSNTTGTAIVEEGAVSNHMLLNNTFVTNMMQNLYYDTVNGLITVPNGNNINTASYTGSMMSMNNTMVNY